MRNKNLSHANIWKSSLCLLTISRRGSMYMVKSSGPNTDPCGSLRCEKESDEEVEELPF